MASGFQDAIPTRPRAADWLAGGGEMGELIRSKDWSRTPLGSIESWPQSLRSAVSILVPSKAQIAMFWGNDLITLYNDAYSPVLGEKHPRALGLPVREVWSEIWNTGLKELFEGVLQTGEAFWASDWPFYLERHGFPEETFFDISYDPIRDESGKVGGLFCIVNDTTARVVGERRLRTLRDLSLSTAAESRSVEDACRVVAEILSENRYDLPFALIYLLDPCGKIARLAGVSGLEPGTPASPANITLGSSAEESTNWPFEAVLQSNRPTDIGDLITRFGNLPSGVWPEPPHTAMVIPIRASGQERATGVLVAGVSPRRPFDDQYRAFFGLLTTQIATTIANARAYEEERRRAEALAELDRAKTTFFSNVSHEFRTPLTLILGPVADLLTELGGSLGSSQRERLEIAHRNGLRLQRLVNTLLDFSRIESDRIQASYEPTDLTTLTADLASNFRAACEKAGLDLVVDCQTLAEPIYVDQSMWEKIVLNLISNAFKFTFVGRIEVNLRATGDEAELTVRDTGVGIPKDELPKVFERFHRVEHSRGRTQEGSGIGLALVQELVQLHGGAVRVESKLGEGSSFTVSIPKGRAHLPTDRISVSSTIAPTATYAEPFVGEALRWVPDSDRDWSLDPAASPSSLTTVNEERARILLADDNADMRDYVQRLLGERYEVETVNDGEAAWKSIEKAIPDLIVSDVMMPVLDGFELLRRVRENPHTQDVPVILLSARAGEESKIQGLEATADDYLIKPFSSRELLASVDAHLRMSELRRQSQAALRANEEHHRRLLNFLPVAVYTCAAPFGEITFYNQRAVELWGRAPKLHDTDKKFCGSFRLWRYDGTPLPHHETPMAVAIREGRSFRNEDVVIERPDGSRINALVNIDPIFDGNGNIVGAVNAFHDTTELKSTQEALRISEERYRQIFEQNIDGVFVATQEGRYLDVSPSGCEMLGMTREEVVNSTFQDLVLPEEHERLDAAAKDFSDGKVHRTEWRFRRKDGSVFLGEVFGRELPDGHLQGIVRDITERKTVEQERDRLISVIEYSPDFIGIADRNQRTLFVNRAGQQLLGLDGLDQVQQTSIQDYFPEEERERIQREVLPILLRDGHWDGEVTFRNFRTGELIPMRWNAFTLPNPASGEPAYFACVSRNITEEKRTEAVLVGQKDVLEMLLQGAPLAEVLDALCRIIEEHSKERLIASVLLLEDGTHLHSIAGNRIPPEYARAIDGLEIGPSAGSCGTAAYRKEAVVVSDIASDPLWEDYRDLALPYGLRACWSTPIVSSHGKVLGTFAVYYDRPRPPSFEDIKLVDLLVRTASIAIQRKQAEDQLKESEQRLRGIFSQTLTGMAQTDLSGRFVQVNNRYCEIVGRSAEELYEMRMQEITHPDDVAHNMEMVATLTEGNGQGFVIEKRYVRPDGTFAWVNNSVSIIKDSLGHPKYVVALSLDISDRRRAEEALATQNERSRLLWEAAAVLLTTEDPHSMLRGLFEKIRHSLGLDVYFNFMLNETGDRLRLVSCAGIPEDTARSIYSLEFGQAVCGTVAVRGEPIVATHIQESLDPMVQLVKSFGIRAYACNPLLAGGHLLGTLSFASRSRDSFKPAETEFIETISQYVTIAYERLRLIGQLREQDRRKDEFLATLAHELRNPLAPIRNGLEVINLSGKNPGTLEQVTTMMQRQVEQMVRLVDDLLDVSRISRNKLELRRQTVELDSVIQSAVETSQPIIDSATHQLQISLPSDPIVLDGDPVRLAQAFSNLLNNAAKYSEPGSQISLTAERQNDELLVKVRDTGIGIEAEKLPRVFDMFVQVDGSEEVSQGGLGVGLTLVKRLIEMHGGQVEAYSEGIGKGSEFLVRLPLVATPDNRILTTPTEASAPGFAAVRRRILVVDDNEDSAESMALMLRFSGHEVVLAHDGLAAVQMAETFKPEVAFLDLGMPKLNGYEAARAIRRQLWGQKIKLVALTGWGQEEDKRRTKEAGFDAHLVKPIDFAKIENLLAEMGASLTPELEMD